MAYYGLANPYIAKLDVATNTYSEGFKCGAAVGTDITPNYVEGFLYGDNVLKEYAKEFKDADVALTVTELPIVAQNVMFGHTATEEGITYKAGDNSNYVGYAFYVCEMVDGIKKFIAAFLPKVKFSETAESYTTKGDNMEFKNPSLAGKASALSDATWKEKKTFATEAETDSWIREKLNMTKVEPASLKITK